MLPRPIFHRPELATRIASDLAGESLIDYSSGLFLAAPRRTGKSTFLRNDLIPECVKREWLPVYVDLWVNKEVDPALLISGAIASALNGYEGMFKKAAKKAGIDKISLLRTLNWDFSKPQLPANVSLSQALDVLHRVAGKPIILIIDEAQHALTSKDGINSMFALKAARDHLNSGVGADGIRMVFTGSSRDKLANLVLRAKQPFYGSSITPFPLLGRDFVEFATDIWNKRLADNNQFNIEDMDFAFDLVGRRPEMFNKLLAEVSVGYGKAEELGELLRNGALNHREGIWSDYESAYNGLSKLQQRVLVVMGKRVQAKQSFAPFTEQTLNEINKLLELAGEVPNATTPNVQKALEVLREKELVWKPARGEYALDDSTMSEWLSLAHGD